MTRPKFEPSESARVLSRQLDHEAGQQNGNLMLQALSSLIVQTDTMRQETQWQSATIAEQQDSIKKLADGLDKVQQQQDGDNRARVAARWAAGVAFAVFLAFGSYFSSRAYYILTIDDDHIQEVATSVAQAQIDKRLKKP